MFGELDADANSFVTNCHMRVLSASGNADDGWQYQRANRVSASSGADRFKRLAILSTLFRLSRGVDF